MACAIPRQTRILSKPTAPVIEGRPLYEAYITETDVLKGTDGHSVVITVYGPFSRVAQKMPGPPFTISSSSGLITIMGLEESNFLFPRTKAWLRGLPCNASDTSDA